MRVKWSDTWHTEGTQHMLPVVTLHFESSLTCLAPHSRPPGDHSRGAWASIVFRGCVTDQGQARENTDLHACRVQISPSPQGKFGLKLPKRKPEVEWERGGERRGGERRVLHLVCEVRDPSGRPVMEVQEGTSSLLPSCAKENKSPPPPPARLHPTPPMGAFRP